MRKSTAIKGIAAANDIDAIQAAIASNLNYRGIAYLKIAKSTYSEMSPSIVLGPESVKVARSDTDTAGLEIQTTDKIQWLTTLMVPFTCTGS